MIGHAVADDVMQGTGDPSGILGIRMAQIFEQPGQQFRQVGPAQEQRLIRIEQHLRRLADQPRPGDRNDGAGRKQASIAVARPGGRSFPVHQCHLMPVALQPDRGRHTNDPGPNDNYMFLHITHLPAPTVDRSA